MFNFFEIHNDFIQMDNRKNRKWNRTTSSSMEICCSYLLSHDEIKNKTILDLGSCIGAFGKWAIENGAKHYTGVEVQEDYYNISNNLFKNEPRVTLLNMSITDFL